jgi:hypothetical protein
VNRVSLANAAPGSIAHAAQVKLTIAVFLMPILFPSSSYELCCYAFGFSDAAAHLVLEITADADQAGSRHEQRTDDLALRALHAYFPIPANAVRR